MFLHVFCKSKNHVLFSLILKLESSLFCCFSKNWMIVFFDSIFIRYICNILKKNCFGAHVSSSGWAAVPYTENKVPPQPAQVRLPAWALRCMSFPYCKATLKYNVFKPRNTLPLLLPTLPLFFLHRALSEWQLIWHCDHFRFDLRTQPQLNNQLDNDYFPLLSHVFIIWLAHSPSLMEVSPI